MTDFGRGERSDDGRFVRQKSTFRDRVTDPQPGRYHLYVSLACPWAHRTVILRRLKGLEDAIGMSIVDPVRDERGWAFRRVPGATGDQVNGWEHLSEAYTATDPDFEGRVTVPVLWDVREGRIVNNESGDLAVILNEDFDEIAAHPERDYYPAELRAEMDELNDFVYENVNNGVYRAGFATTQDAYEEAVFPLFDALAMLDERLATRRYLLGDRQTLADWRLFTTLIRFDAVYVSHFKCNLRRIVDHPNLWPYLRDLYQTPGVAETVDMDHIKRHYFTTHGDINPTRVIPAGPILDFTAPHERAALEPIRR